MCPEEGGMNHKRVRGGLWADACFGGVGQVGERGARMHVKQDGCLGGGGG